MKFLCEMRKISKINLRDGEVAQQLKSPGALSKDMGAVFSTYTVAYSHL